MKITSDKVVTETTNMNLNSPDTKDNAASPVTEVKMKLILHESMLPCFEVLWDYLSFCQCVAFVR